MFSVSAQLFFRKTENSYGVREDLKLFLYINITVNFSNGVSFYKIQK